jgi:hypothetical protein
MKQNSTGSVVVTGAGEGLTPESLGPNTEGPMCTDWRVKAFELADHLNTAEENEKTLTGTIRERDREIKHWKLFGIVGWIVALAGWLFAARG